MTVMTRVKVVRKVRGDPGRAVTPLGSVVGALLTHLTRSSPYASIIVPVSELTRRRLRDVFAAPKSHSLEVPEQGPGRWPVLLPHANDSRAPGEQNP